MHKVHVTWFRLCQSSFYGQYYHILAANQLLKTRGGWPLTSNQSRKQQTSKTRQKKCPRGRQTSRRSHIPRLNWESWHSHQKRRRVKVPFESRLRWRIHQRQKVGLQSKRPWMGWFHNAVKVWLWSNTFIILPFSTLVRFDLLRTNSHQAHKSQVQNLLPSSHNDPRIKASWWGPARNQTSHL